MSDPTKKTGKDKSDNFLNFVPSKSQKYKWDDQDGNVTIYVENRGFFNFLAQKLLKKPRVSQIHLEEMGSFIWPLIDGKKNIYDIGQLVSKHFGDKAEPLYPRLVKYFKMLKDYDFVELKKPD